MIEDEENFLEVKALGEDLAWRVIKLWMQSAGRDLNNYQVRGLYSFMKFSTLVANYKPAAKLQQAIRCLQNKSITITKNKNVEICTHKR